MLTHQKASACQHGAANSSGLIMIRQAVPATGVPVTGTLDSRPSRDDEWATRMREKYGPVYAPADYDSDADEEYTFGTRSINRQPIPVQPVLATGVPVTETISRDYEWATRMREKYGIDTSELTYNSNEPNRNQQGYTQPTSDRARKGLADFLDSPLQPTKEKSRCCSIM